MVVFGAFVSCTDQSNHAEICSLPLSRAAGTDAFRDSVGAGLGRGCGRVHKAVVVRVTVALDTKTSASREAEEENA